MILRSISRVVQLSLAFWLVTCSGGRIGDGEEPDSGATSCDQVECPPGSYCVRGQCLSGDPCDVVVCSNPGEVCSGGVCVPGVDDGDDDGYPAREDCDDQDAAVYPGVERSCTNDCGEGLTTCSEDGRWSECLVDGCELPHAVGECVEGQCLIVECETGWGDCDGVSTNGCEANPDWTATGGGDHCGTDWTPADAERIAGRHWNIGVFRIDAGATVALLPSSDGGGELEIEAERVEIAGTLEGTGAGHLGGNGGGGQRSGNPYCGGDGATGAAGNGPHGGRGGSGGTGNNGDHSSDSGCRYSNGGNGSPGSDGGYAVAGGNGDTTTDAQVWMGSGGGGGGGGGAGSRFGSNDNFPAGTGGGGGAGGRGGGAIRLTAVASVSVAGVIRSAGTRDGGDGGAGEYLNPCTDRYSNPSGGAPGNASGRGNGRGGGGVRQDQNCNGGGVSNTVGGTGAAGGAGAGGGVLLGAPNVEVSGTIDLRGGGDSTANGGTLKVFACESLLGTLSTGRTFESTLDTCE